MVDKHTLFFMDDYYSELLERHGLQYDDFSGWVAGSSVQLL